MNEDISYKDSYDESLQFSRITHANWMAPDRKGYVPLGVAKEDWVAPFLEPRLDAAVPQDIVQVFEIARGCMIYSWFFYPLATLGLEQCMRIGEFAVSERCRMLQQESDKFFVNLQTLVSAGVISTEDEKRWQALRQLRNNRSHLKSFMLVDPGMAIQLLNTTTELINRLFSTPAQEGAAVWEAAITKYLNEVWLDWQASRKEFPKNTCNKSHWPVPFFGSPEKALVATVGVNPSAGEFRPDRGWASVKSNADWIHRLKNYFRHTIPAHDWFEPWRIALELLRMSYESGTATHFDVSYRPTTAMLTNSSTDPAEFRRMVERDVVWFFRLLPLCPKLRGLLVFGPIVRSDGACESLVEFVRKCALQNGFTVLQSGGLRHTQTGREFFLHEASTPGERCVTCRVAKNLYKHRKELRRKLA